ncbi:helix-turn-helix domain-containing protein, partial [Halorhodospira neutriphila]
MSDGQQSEHEAEPGRQWGAGDGAPEQPESRSGVGARLRQAREAQGRSARAVASSLNLPLVTVEALEGGEREGLPPTTFVRGYLRNYAQLVGLDPEE